MFRVVFVTDPYLEPLYDGIVDFALSNVWIVFGGMRRTGLFPAHVNPHGMIGTFVRPEILNDVRRLDCPAVRMLHPHDDIAYGGPFASVVADYHGYGVTGARHLLSLGAPSFAFYRRLARKDSTAVRDGFEKTIRGAGHQSIRIDYPEDHPDDPSTSDRSDPVRTDAWLKARVSELPKPCAIMAEDDRFGTQITRVVLQAGLGIPEDVAVLGCGNNEPDVRLARVPMSSIDGNLRRMGYIAAATLDRMMRGKEPPPQPIVAPSGDIVVRQSTMTYSSSSSHVEKAARLIRLRYQEPLSVAAIARHAGTSARRLQAEFGRVLGQGMHAEILRCRLEHAERLLYETDMKVMAVALESGFGTERSFSRCCYAKHGIPPATLRLRLRNTDGANPK